VQVMGIDDGVVLTAVEECAKPSQLGHPRARPKTLSTQEDPVSRGWTQGGCSSASKQKTPALDHSPRAAPLKPLGSRALYACGAISRRLILRRTRAFFIGVAAETDRQALVDHRLDSNRLVLHGSIWSVAWPIWPAPRSQLALPLGTAGP